MKRTATLYLTSLISIAATAVCLGEDPTTPSPAPAPATAPAAPVATAPATTPTTSILPYGTTEVVKMYQGGINKEILIGFIDSSTLPFHLSADNIIYLQHMGFPQDVTAAMMRRDGELQKAGLAYQQQMAPPPGAPMPGYQQPPPAGPNVMMPDSSAPLVDPYPPVVAQPVDPGYAYPYYGYPYYYGPNVVVGGWWGPGWGWRGGFGPGFRGGFVGHGGFAGHGGGGFHH